jgi:hypothetical protein
VPQGWNRLAELIRAEVARQGGARAFAESSGIGQRTVERLENGEQSGYRTGTIDRLEAAMGWQHGSVDRVLEGGQPQPLPDPIMAKILDAWPHLSRRDRRVVLALVEALRQR